MHDPEAFVAAKAAVRPITANLVNQMLESNTWTASHKPRVLDYGCGPGKATLAYIVPNAEKWDGHIVGVDSAAEMVEHAKEKSAHPLVEYHQANLFDPEGSSAGDSVLALGSYDIIICNQVIHFLKPHKEAREALARLGSLLKPGGQLGFVNMTKSPYYTLLQELGDQPEFKACMEAHEYKKYIPDWVERDVDFEQDLRRNSAMALPPWLQIKTLETKRLKNVDVGLETAVDLMYSLGPLAGSGRVSKNVELGVKDWYRQCLGEKYEIGDRGEVKGSGGETVIGVLQKLQCPESPEAEELKLKNP